MLTEHVDGHISNSDLKYETSDSHDSRDADIFSNTSFAIQGSKEIIDS